MLHSKFLCVVSLATVLMSQGCETGVAPSNPFDPDAPSATRETASVTGTIYLEGRTDHSGIQVRLEGYSGNAATTSADGSYTLTDLNSDLDYMVVAEYTLEPNLEFNTAELAAPNLAPGETRTLATTTLVRAPFPPAVLDAVKTGEDAITVYWVESEDEDVTSYQVYVRAGATSAYSPDPTVCPNGDSEIDGILSCEITGLHSYEQYSFKVTAIDETRLESSYSLEDVFQFIYPEPASIMYLDEEKQNPFGLIVSADSTKAYTLTFAGGTTNDATLSEIDIQNELETGCAQVTSYHPDNGDTVSFLSGLDTVVPVDSPIVQQTYGTPKLINDTQGQSTVWIPYTVIYQDAFSTPFQGFASLDLSSGLPAKPAEGDCQLGAWKHTIVSMQPNNISGTLTHTFAGSAKLISLSCKDNDCKLYQYDMVSQRLQSPEFLWRVPFALHQLAFSQGTLIAISKSSSQLFLGDLATLESTTSSTVASPESIAVIGDTGYCAVAGSGSVELAIIDLTHGLDVYRLSVQADNPKLTTALMLNEANSSTAVLYVAHGESKVLSMYNFTQPTVDPPLPGHRYLTPLQCTATCRIEIGGDPQALTISPDGSTVLALDSKNSTRLFQFTQTPPN